MKGTNKYLAYIQADPIPSVEIIDLVGINPYSHHSAEFIIIQSQENHQQVLNLKVESESSPVFKQTEVKGTDVLIGYGNRAILFNLLNKKTKFVIKFQGYFSEFTLYEQAIYITTDSEIICINWQGKQKWLSADLGIDGVRIQSIEDGKIKGIGEWDPPGGWQTFELDQNTGKPINNTCER
ncbi:hypothetical protein Q0590_06875 [Rhodocytophaga aerolata]|uniref:Uncharacterized protein n=1 Tax=Rhodocytophaga aerolata TaxID=455078 RepID=A0ABT8R1J6_9BACT|nr:hypothetical protein [Rhodocytophaga aerolata]MDO1445968.1 hypothetical protein [Rhodocytophaga aerolata]